MFDICQLQLYQQPLILQQYHIQRIQIQKLFVKRLEVLNLQQVTLSKVQLKRKLLLIGQLPMNYIYLLWRQKLVSQCLSSEIVLRWQTQILLYQFVYVQKSGSNKVQKNALYRMRQARVYSLQ